MFRQLRVVSQLSAIWRGLNRHGGQDGTLLGTVRDRRTNALGFLLDRTIHRPAMRTRKSVTSERDFRGSTIFYSQRKATTGSTLEARRAGM